MDIEKLNQLNVLLVDDEPIIAYSIQSTLEEMGFQKFEIVHSKAEALEKIESCKIDLAILDINLGEGEEGIALAKSCAQNNIPFFYVTSYNDTTTLDKALVTAPGAYVEKPFMPSNLYAAIKLTLQQASKKTNNSFSFKNKGELIKLELNDILYLRADDVYIDIVTKNKTYLHRSSLKKILTYLPRQQFINTHRAYVVNLQHVSNITLDTVELKGASVPLSRTYKQELKERFLQNNF
ncbi:MAG: response regulator transcription factor [Flavobacteriales bacterium]|nr:response regulator transcription factor [Flavobacteriales bacterium]